MPLCAIYQLVCDDCGASIPVKATIDLMLRRPARSNLEPQIKPDPDRIIMVAERVVDPDPTHWLVQPGYPDHILCPACKTARGC